jgi:hypothetical protein
MLLFPSCSLILATFLSIQKFISHTQQDQHEQQHQQLKFLLLKFPLRKIELVKKKVDASSGRKRRH